MKYIHIVQIRKQYGFRKICVVRLIIWAQKLSVILYATLSRPAVLWGLWLHRTAFYMHSEVSSDLTFWLDPIALRFPKMQLVLWLGILLYSDWGFSTVHWLRVFLPWLSFFTPYFLIRSNCFEISQNTTATLTEVFLTLTEVFLTLTEVFLTLTEVFLTLTEVFLTLTEAFLTLTAVFHTLLFD